MEISIKKLLVHDVARKDENCKSNTNRMVYGAVVFANPVGANSPTQAVNLTDKELNMLCRDLGIKGRDTSGNLVSSGKPAWETLLQTVNRYRGATADVEVEERRKGESYTDTSGEQKQYETDSSNIRVTMIRFRDEVIDRLDKKESTWLTGAKPLPSVEDFGAANMM